MESKDNIDLEDRGREVSIRPGSVYRLIDEVHSPGLISESHPVKAGQSKGASGVRIS